MRLPACDLTRQDELQEFDIWITPSLGEITDTARFKEELALIAEAIEAIGLATDEFADAACCEPGAIAGTLATLVSARPVKERYRLLSSLASTLFLVTGKSDNNFKCQFPLFLRDEAEWSCLPYTGRRRSAAGGIPRVLKSEDYMNLVACTEDKAVEEKLLREILRFLLIDAGAVRQLWSVGRSYFMLKPYNCERDLLAPLVVFKVRGSVMASGGHEPEKMLRARMREWGLQDGIDHNLSDVVVVDENTDPEGKTRAYDFVLPFRSPCWPSGWAKRLFVQCQFYAGDSGSVSHKNVDQTNSSRKNVLGFVPDARFIEYVDGAGYFSALNGDLRKLLAYQTTKSFFQVRTASIRLRRELQELGFITPLEVEHAVVATDGSPSQVAAYLQAGGYDAGLVAKALDTCQALGLASASGDGALRVSPMRRDAVRRYLLLDVVAKYGSKVGNAAEPGGRMLIPGYGAFFGLPLDDMVARAATEAPSLRDEVTDAQTTLSDVRWLCEQKLAMAR